VKVKIKSFNGELPYYLTLNKEYELTQEIDKYGISQILSDDNYPIIVQVIHASERLKGGSWEIVE